MTQPRDRAIHRDVIIKPFATYIERAIALAHDEKTEPMPAVHQFRKSLRKARAMLRLVERQLPAREFKLLARRLRRAHRAASRFRDADVLVDTLERLHDEGAPAPRELVERLARKRQASWGTGSARLELARAAERLHDAPARLERALPEQLLAADLADGLRRTYRRARDAGQRAQRHRKFEDVHAFRKRAKEMDTQLELCAELPVFSRRVAQLSQRFAALAKELGVVTDTALVRDHLIDVRGGLSETSRRALLASLDKQVRERLDKALPSGVSLTQPRPRELAAGLLRRAPASRA